MLALVVGAIAFYSMSLAPVTWVVISEIFPNRIRGSAISVAVLATWTACTVLTFTFPILKERLGLHSTFWLYGIICVAGFVYIYEYPRDEGQVARGTSSRSAAGCGGPKLHRGGISEDGPS